MPVLNGPNLSVRFLLLPGMDGTGRLFQPLIDELQEQGFEVSVFSYPPDRIESLPQTMERLAQATRQLSGYFLVAESFSSLLAIHFAARSPYNLLGIVLCAGFASPIQGFRIRLAGCLSSWAFSLPQPALLLKWFLLNDCAEATLLPLVTSAIRSVSPQVLASRLRWLLSCDMRDEFAAITVPVKLLQPARDRLISPDVAVELVKLRPETSLEVIAGPHLLLQCNPKESANSIVAFTASVIGTLKK